MNVYSAIQRRRTIRRFKETPIAEGVLIKLVDTARLAPSAGNIQPLEYIIVCSKEKCRAVFPLLKWARNIKPDDAPPEGNRPTAYIIVLINREISPKGGGHETGAAVQNIMLAALEDDIGSCWMRSVEKSELKILFNVPEYCDIDSVIALGKPGESPMTEPARDDETEYWRDDRGLMHVPKRKLGQILHREKY
ncbi:MAG: nitroreductase family protein [bacterium]